MPKAEIEIRVKVEHRNALAAFLQKDAKHIRTSHQVDEYFNPPDQDFTTEEDVTKWFRIRSEDHETSLNYKRWIRDPETKESLYAEESETVIGSADTMRDILRALGFRPIIVCDKTRITYHWHDYEILLDTVKGLGDFVEMEYLGQRPRSEASAINTEMIQFLKDHGAGKIQRNSTGYPFQLMFPNKPNIYTEV